MFYPQKSRCGPGKRRPGGISLEIFGKVQIRFHIKATIKDIPYPRGSHDDLLVPEPIAIRLICHGFFFLIGAFRDPPKRKSRTDLSARLGWVVVYGGKKTACLMPLCGESHLLPFFWIWLQGC
jgi:hypothetical protein